MTPVTFLSHERPVPKSKLAASLQGSNEHCPLLAFLNACVPKVLNLNPRLHLLHRRRLNMEAHIMD